MREFGKQQEKRNSACTRETPRGSLWISQKTAYRLGKGEIIIQTPKRRGKNNNNKHSNRNAIPAQLSFKTEEETIKNGDFTTSSLAWQRILNRILQNSLKFPLFYLIWMAIFSLTWKPRYRNAGIGHIESSVGLTSLTWTSWPDSCCKSQSYLCRNNTESLFFPLWSGGSHVQSLQFSLQEVRFTNAYNYAYNGTVTAGTLVSL